MFDKKACVYVVGRDYQILFNTTEHGIAWVEVGGEVYPDEKNGLLRSETLIHRAVVPMDKLDAAREYTVCFRALPERKPYWPVLGETEKQTYAFQPVDWNRPVHIYHVADAHSHAQEAIETGSFFGDALDLLVMNGDIPAESKTEQDILSVFDMIGGITNGTRPVIYVRGNHDTRGRYAEEFTDYIGTDAGNTYFTFRLGRLWGIALDCGEDKLDTSEEYGGIVSCHRFRQRQTEFLKRVLENADHEYNAPGVERRFAICHVPFMTELMANSGDKFDIEREIYAEWTRELNKMGLDLMLCGHEHKLFTFMPGDEKLRYGASFPVLVGSQPFFFRDAPDPHRFIGTALTVGADGIHAEFTDNRGWHEHAMDLK